MAPPRAPSGLPGAEDARRRAPSVGEPLHRRRFESRLLYDRGSNAFQRLAHSRRRRHCLASLGGVFLLSLAADLQASNERDDAKSVYAHGLDRLRVSDYEAAITAFERAYAIEPNAAVLFNLGMAYAAAGRAVDAVRVLDAYLEKSGEQLSASRSREVAHVLAEQRARVASLVVEGPADGQLWLDGAQMPRSNAEAPLLLDPGEHLLRFDSPLWQRTARLSVRAGEMTRFVFVLPPAAESFPRENERLSKLDAGLSALAIGRERREDRPRPVPSPALETTEDPSPKSSTGLWAPGLRGRRARLLWSDHNRLRPRRS